MASERIRSVLDFWQRDGYGESDPADETLMTGAEYESRMKLKATSVGGRQQLLDAAASGRVRYPGWLAQHLGLCPRCQRPAYDTDHVLCELCRVDIPDELEF